MTEEHTDPVEDTAEEARSAPPEEAPEEAPQAAHAPKPAAQEVELDALDSGKGGLLSKLNPLNLFKKDTPARHITDGRELLENKNFAQATIAFNKALALDENSAEAYRGLGDTLVKKGGRSNIAGALEHYLKVVEIDPFNDTIYGTTARVFDILNKPKEATLERKKMVVIRTLSTDARNPIANNNMGILLLRQNRTVDAIKYFQKAIDSDQRYDMAIRNLATVYYKLATSTEDAKKKEEFLSKAESQISKAIDIASTIPNLLTYGRILMQTGKNEQAMELVERAEELDSASKDVFGLKKMLLERLNRMDEARDAFESYQVFSKDEEAGAGGPPREE